MTQGAILSTLAPGRCPVYRRGVALRDVCETCTGHAQSGQRRLERGTYLHMQGDEADGLYLVSDGVLKETYVTEDGRAQGIRLLQAGDVTGTEALVEPTYQCAVEALTDARVCRISIRDVERRIAERPDQGLAMTRALAGELHQLRQQIVLLGPSSAEERVLSTLKQLCRGADTAEWTKLPLSRLELAELLGLAHETVSRIVQRLARDGLIDVQGRRVRILNAA